MNWSGSSIKLNYLVLTVKHRFIYQIFFCLALTCVNGVGEKLLVITLLQWLFVEKHA